MIRPLDRVSSIKVKLSIVIVAAVGVAALVSIVGLRMNIPVALRPPIAASISLLLVYPLSRGITSPLREMADASRALADGRYDTPITATSLDEVGELARAFQSMRADLADAERQRRELVANASHELRTPLAALQARLENMVDGVEPVDNEALEGALVQVQNLSGLVSQLLDLTRLESGTAHLDRQRVDLTELAIEIAKETQLTQPDIRIEVTAPPALEVEVDRLRLGQVLRNLLNNAVSHAPVGTAVILRAGAVDGRIEVSVSDGGPGIPAGEQDRVFERFHRVLLDAGPVARSGGSGLGLAITRSIVELHGGTVRMEPNEPCGCRAVVILPAI